MNIQVNLLPEAKLAKMRNQAKRKLYTSITTALAVVFGVSCITFVMLYVFLIGTYQAGKNTADNLKQEISKSSVLEEKAATLQENLAAFYSLNETRTYSSRVFVNLFNVIPTNVSISSVSISGDGKLSITGTTDSFLDVSKLANSFELYNVDYLPQEGLERKPIFSGVNITGLSKSEDGKTGFTLDMKVDQEILKKQVEN